MTTAEEAKARRNASLLALATRLGRLGAWSMNVPDMTLCWSGEALAIFDIADDAPVTMASAAEFIHPEWRDEVRQAMELCCHNGVGFDVEVRALTTRGAPLWIRLIGESERSSTGEVLHVQGAMQDISERKEAAERYRHLSERLSRTLASITDAFFSVDREWRFTYLNPEAERLLGTTSAELLGKLLWDFFPGSRNSRFFEEFQRSTTANTTSQFETFSKSLDAWLLVVAYPSTQGLAVYLRDVTESRRTQEALLESEERFRLLFETSVDAIVQTSEDGLIRGANPAACEMFGRPGYELLGLERTALLAPEETKLGLDHFLQARQGEGKVTGELMLGRADGTKFHAEVVSSQYRTSHAGVLTTTIIRDVSERKRHEQEILLMNALMGERIEQRTADLERANAQLKAFAHSLAHDLRSPVAAMKGFCSLLQESLEASATERDKHYLRRVQAAAVNLDDSIEALLSLATISQAPLRVEDVDLSSTADDILADLQAREPHRSATLIVQEGLHTLGDPRLLRMCLENLLGNAWKFTSKRSLGEIRFGACRSLDGELVYFVRDNGAGFDMAYAEKVFGAFQRLHSAAEFPGTGIGLANVQKILERHDGRIWADAAEGKGALFRFTIGVPRASPSVSVPRRGSSRAGTSAVPAASE